MAWRDRRHVGLVLLGPFVFAALLIATYATRPGLVLDLPDDPRATSQGIYGVEHSETLTWNWMAPHAQLSLPSLDRRIAWSGNVSVRHYRPPNVPVPRLRVLVNGTVVFDRTLNQRVEQVPISIPSRRGASGATLTFDTDPPFLPGAGETRELGVAIEPLTLRPAGLSWPPSDALGNGALILLEAALLLAALGLPWPWVAVLTISGAAGQAWVLTRQATLYARYPFPTAETWLVRALAAAALLHLIDWLAVAWSSTRTDRWRTPFVHAFEQAAQRLGGLPKSYITAGRMIGRAGAYVLPAVLLVHAVAFWGFGVMDQEAMSFVGNYLAPRPVVAKIFDPRLNDWGMYQARELSYLFDMFDARVFATLLDRQMLLLVPLSGALGIVAFIAIYLRGTRTVLNLDRPTACLLLSLFLSCIVVQASTAVFYRSGKIVLSVLLLMYFFQLTILIRGHVKTQNASWRPLGTLFLLSFGMAMTDRQGVFFVAAATGVIGALWLTSMVRERRLTTRHLTIVSIGVLALAVAELYDYVIAPRIVLRLNGYWPDFSYQSLAIFSPFDWDATRFAWQMFQTQIGYFFGNTPFLVVSVLSVAAWVATIWPSRTTGRVRSTIATLLTDDALVMLVATSGALVALLFLMIVRHPPVFFTPDHAFWYYTLTLHVVFLFGITLWSSQLRPMGLSRRFLVPAIVLLMIASNATHYAEQRTLMVNSERWFKAQYERSQRIVRAFNMRHAAVLGEAFTGTLATPSSSALKAEEEFLAHVQIAYRALSSTSSSGEP